MSIPTPTSASTPHSRPIPPSAPIPTPTSRLPELLLSDTNARLAAARRLTSRRGRDEAGLFLAEGAQAVGEAVREPDSLVALYATDVALQRHADVLADAPVAVAQISAKAAAALSETVTPQGIVAVCRLPRHTLADVVAAGPRLLVVLVEPNEPGNLGAIVRTADAAGAEAIVVHGGADPFGGKAVRASAGSIFHLPVVTGGIDVGSTAVMTLLDTLHAAGLQTLATTGRAEYDLDELAAAGSLGRPTAWLFGNEARGLPAELLTRAHRTVRVPIYGRAESLNLAAAAAVCLYAGARAQHMAGEARAALEQPAG